jgi:hypothetical protein
MEFHIEALFLVIEDAPGASPGAMGFWIYHEQRESRDILPQSRLN